MLIVTGVFLSLTVLAHGQKMNKIILAVPQYYQAPKDSACGPMTIRMVADYYYEKEKREMTATEWLSILDITMKNNIWRTLGTKKEDIIRALSTLKFDTRLIKGSEVNAKIQAIRQAIEKEHPVIIYCVIRPSIPERHFAVVVGIDQDSIYIRDPYPRKRNNGKPRKIGLNVFKAITPKIGGLVWGRVKWGIEVIK